MDPKKTSINILKVKELFPDLGDGFVLKCLEHYQNNCELVVNHLLEDSLAPQLSSIPRDLPLQTTNSTQAPKKTTPPPHSQETLVSQRRNIYQDDEFDVFSGKQLDMSKVHIGKKPIGRGKFFTKPPNPATRNFARRYEYDEYDDEPDDSLDEFAAINIGEGEAEKNVLKMRSQKTIDIRSSNESSDSEDSKEGEEGDDEEEEEQSQGTAQTIPANTGRGRGQGGERGRGQNYERGRGRAQYSDRGRGQNNRGRGQNNNSDRGRGQNNNSDRGRGQNNNRGRGRGSGEQGEQSSGDTSTNYQQKNKNKASYANHNRKSQSQQKRKPF